MKNIYTPSDVSTILNVSESIVKMWMERDVIKSYRLPVDVNGYYTSRENLTLFIRGRGYSSSLLEDVQ